MVLAGLISAVVFLVCIALALAGLIPVAEAGPLTALIAGLVGGTLPFITIVLAINQLVLSQELGWIDTLRGRMEGMQGFRNDVETLTGTPVSPAAPAEFLRILVQHADDLVGELSTRCGDAPNEDLRTDTTGLEEMMASRSGHVAEELERAEFGTFDALSASLDYQTGQYLHRARRLRADHDDALSTATEGTIEDLIETLSSLDIARQYFKTLYTQYELAVLSRLLLYAGFPALFGGALVILSYGTITELQPGRGVLVVLLSTTVVVAFAPFTVLLAYALRIATLATYTADFGPFVPRSEFSGRRKE